jgi:hypothetical protein
VSAQSVPDDVRAIQALPPVPAPHGQWAPGGTWSPPAPVPPPVDRAPAAALWVFWVGLAAVTALRAVPDPFWSDLDALMTWLYGVDALLVTVLAVVGLLARRGGLAGSAVVAWLAGAGLLLGTVELWNHLVQDRGMSSDTVGHLARATSALVVTLFAVAYLAVRRSRGVSYAFVPVVLLVAVGWFEVVPLLFDALPGNAGTWRARAALFSTGGLALTAGLVALARRATRPVPATAGIPVPRQPWTVAPPAGPGGWAAPYPVPVASTNTLSIVALVLGLVGVSPGAVVCGHIALGQIRRTGEQGRGMAIAGLVLGYVGLAVTVLALVAVFGLLAMAPSY